MPFLDLPDLRLYYEFEPALGKPALLLSNPLGANLSMWSPQMPQLSTQFSVLRYDNRGHGQSSVPQGPYSIHHFGGDVIALLDHLGLDRVHFCGLSMGGVIGQWLGIHAPQRLHRLVLSNTAAKIGTVEGWNARIYTVLRSGMQAVVPAILDRWLTERFRREHPAEVDRTAAMLLAANAEGYAAACAAVRDMDHRFEVSSIPVPTLVIFGDQDESATPADARFLIQNIPRARALELRTAHLANVESPHAFAIGLLKFLLGPLETNENARP